ncbi:MAG: DUF2157 domain-containing protein [Nitriliruptorales bacterium]
MADVDKHLKAWLGEGLLTPEQAERIRQHERTASEAAGSRSRVAEAVGYLGGSLALVAVLVAVSEFWADLEVWSQIALLALLTALLFAGGWGLRVAEDKPIQRLGSVLWLLSAGAFAFLLGVIGSDAIDLEDDVVALVIGIGTAAYGFALWRVRETALQHITMAVGVLVALVAALMLPERAIDQSFVGLAAWGLGVVWALLTWGELLPPRWVGYALGGLAALFGAQLMAVGTLEVWGHVVGILTSAAMIAASVAVGSLVLLVLGAVGAFGFVSATVFRYFGDTVGVPLALFVVGLALVGVAFLIARLRPRVQSGHRLESGAGDV